MVGKTPESAPEGSEVRPLTQELKRFLERKGIPLGGIEITRIWGE
jgi:hypothetical protein